MSEAYIVLQCTSVGIICTGLLIVKKKFWMLRQWFQIITQCTAFSPYTAMDSFFFLPFLDSSAWLLTFGRIYNC